MKNLYLETKHGVIPLDESIINKYNLEKGTLSPFTHNRIVDKNGEYIRVQQKDETNRASLMVGDDEIDTMENGIRFSTSEMLDIAEGVDSV